LRMKESVYIRVNCPPVAYVTVCVSDRLGHVTIGRQACGTTAVGVGPGPAESATGPMEKMLHRGGDTPVQPHTVERGAGSCSGRHPQSDFKFS
jgi:hypothetical protein